MWRIRFSQNTTNFDVSRKFDKLNSFGAEYRNENFQIKQGQPESYNTYDINGGVVTELPQTILKFLPLLYWILVGNFAQEHLKFSQVSSQNAVDKGRNSAAVYADLEYDVTENGCLTVPFVTRIILILRNYKL
jgi:iron complex outermembrane receptor protein